MGHSEQGHSLSRLRTGSCVKPGLGKVTSWKSQTTTFPRSLENPANNARFPLFQPCDGGDVFTPSGLQDRSMSERNGLNRRGSNLCGNENPSKFDPLCRPATRGLHHGQELSSTNRSDTFAQTNPPTQRFCLQSDGGPYIFHEVWKSRKQRAIPTFPTLRRRRCFHPFRFARQINE
jgi:hypothetical protein